MIPVRDVNMLVTHPNNTLVLNQKNPKCQLEKSPGVNQPTKMCLVLGTPSNTINK